VRVLQFIEEQHRSRSRGGGASAAQQQRRDGCAWALLLDADAFVRAPAGTDLLRRLMPLQLTAQQPDPQTLASGAAFAARLQSLAPAADLSFLRFTFSVRRAWRASPSSAPGRTQSRA